MVRHGWLAITGARGTGVIGQLDWAALAIAELALLLVALHTPRIFYLRTFRLLGVAVAANAVVILFPLPDVLVIYGRSVPEAMVFSLAAGVLAVAVVCLVSARWATSDTPAPPDPWSPGERALPAAIVAATLLVLPIWFATSGLPPLFSLAGTSATDLALSRQESFSRLDHPALRLVLGMLRNLLVMFAAGWFVAEAASTPKWWWRQRSSVEVAALAVVGLGTFFALLTTERAIVGELLVVCAVSYMVIRRRELSAMLVGALAAGAALFPIAVGYLSGASDFGGVLAGLKRRALYLPAEVMTRYFIEFPRLHDFLRGESVPKLSYLTGGETFDLSGYMYLRYYQRVPGANGNANGSFFGSGWANFGFMGVVLWACLAAIALVVLDRCLDRLPSRSAAALRGLGVVFAVLTTSTDIFRSVLGFLPGYIDLVVVVAVVAWVIRRRTVPRPVATQPLASTDGGSRGQSPDKRAGRVGSRT